LPFIPEVDQIVGLSHDGSFIIILHEVGRGTLIINVAMAKFAFERGQSTLKKILRLVNG
jgi:hypothetical protein